jgi:hypothetical protein
VIEPTIVVFDRPSFEGQPLIIYWKDVVLPISGVTVGDGLPEHNRIWYQIGEIGYAHSASIQPVRTTLNEPTVQIHPDGTLAEVTVPFVDAYLEPSRESEIAYRCYYATTHWVRALVQDERRDAWYKVWDDRLQEDYFVPARELRLIPDGELSPLSPDVPSDEKRLEVRIEQQMVVAYEGEQAVYTARASTGDVEADTNWNTPMGQFRLTYKRPTRHMTVGNRANGDFDLPGVPWVSYFTEDGIAFHGAYWHNDFGRPRSHGCVNLSPRAAKWVYRWSQPVVPPNVTLLFESNGTRIDII